MKLPHPFYATKIGESTQSWEIELNPNLSNYSCSLQYDDAGNANITITSKHNGEVMLDFCLDNGEINIMSDDFIKMTEEGN